MPNALMEAMAMELPAISTKVSGAMDVARDGVEALYYEAGDAETLAQHVRALAGEPARARALGAAAAARIREFSVPRLVQTFESILDRAQ
jgi:glycosyltransferase involved in cell wall biosynthesis